jgi:hypothetical protein
MRKPKSSLKTTELHDQEILAVSSNIFQLSVGRRWREEDPQKQKGVRGKRVCILYLQRNSWKLVPAGCTTTDLRFSELQSCA